MKGKARVVGSSFNAGKVKQGSTVEHSFVIKNVGTDTLWVGNAKTS